MRKKIIAIEILLIGLKVEAKSSAFTIKEIKNLFFKNREVVD